MRTARNNNDFFNIKKQINIKKIEIIVELWCQNEIFQSTFVNLFIITFIKKAMNCKKIITTSSFFKIVQYQRFKQRSISRLYKSTKRSF